MDLNQISLQNPITPKMDKDILPPGSSSGELQNFKTQNNSSSSDTNMIN